MKNKKPATDTWFSEPVYSDQGLIAYNYRGRTHKLWYGRIGEEKRLPALILHGGPGGSHYNLVAFQALGDRRAVIFYDQLGCGKSERPDDPSLWVAERYFDEVRSVRDALRLKKYHLVGHSWGTVQAVGFAASYPEGIVSLSLHSPVLSFPEYIERVAPVLKKSLPGEAARIIDDYELKGLGDKKSYEEACLEFVKRYVTHTWPLPEPMQKLIGGRNSQVHDVMVASESELNVPGNLKSVDLTGKLARLDMPVLMTCGASDVCTPEYTRWQSGFARDGRLVIIPDSAHMTPIDNPGELIRIENQFLEEIEGKGS